MLKDFEKNTNADLKDVFIDYNLHTHNYGCRVDIAIAVIFCVFLLFPAYQNRFLFYRVNAVSFDNSDGRLNSICFSARVVYDFKHRLNSCGSQSVEILFYGSYGICVLRAISSIIKACYGYFIIRFAHFTQFVDCV
mgnify:CR=1 FL=1